jgi:hypothetical protein
MTARKEDGEAEGWEEKRDKERSKSKPRLIFFC